MRKITRGILGYLLMIAAFIFLVVLLSGGINSENRRIEYPELLE